MKGKILTFFSGVTGLLFINGGLNKIFNYMPVPDDLPQELMNDFNALVEIYWLMPLIAIAETLGGLLIIFPRTRAVGTLILFPVSVGILLTHIFVDQSQLLIPIFIWFILIWIIYDNRQKYLPLLAANITTSKPSNEDINYASGVSTDN